LTPLWRELDRISVLVDGLPIAPAEVRLRSVTLPRSMSDVWDRLSRLNWELGLKSPSEIALIALSAVKVPWISTLVPVIDLSAPCKSMPFNRK
jgi:hypothetical protein